ncbi:MFS transporter [Mesorhizobium sp. B1-1-5]|nr:MFS transporter [Mesorhizobium sp. B1-1-5]
MLSVHLLMLLQLRGASLAAAVGLGALVGPSQVGARVAELLIGRNRHHPIWTMLTSVTLLAAGIWLLLTSQTFVALALILYGAGNGIHTIARGALPLVLFDPQQYAVLMGKLATPSLIVQAAAPSVGALLLGTGGANLVLVTLALAATVNAGLCICLLASMRR